MLTQIKYTVPGIKAEAEERGRVRRVEAATETVRAFRAVSWRTRFGACERLLLQKKALLERLPNNESLKKEVADLEKCYADLLAEQPSA